jgi:hypothetical protein
MTRPAILERLRGVQRTGDGWTAFCPAHEDRAKRSLSVNSGTDGRTLLHCFVGCAVEAICAAVNMTLADLAPPVGPGGPAGRRSLLTLEAFARAKGLPLEFLRQQGVREDGASLIITYRLRDGSLAARQRRRSALLAREGSSWDGPRGEALVAYGLWTLDAAIEKGELLVVEGESDWLTATYHHVPALGLPGADMVKTLTADVIRGIERVYVLQEPDRGGDTFVRRIAARLTELSWTGQAFAMRLPEKDLNALHLAAGERFADILLEAKAAAIPLADVAISLVDGTPSRGVDAEPELRREGFDQSLVWPDGVRFALTAIRDGRDGVRGELTVTRQGRRLSWGVWSLASTQAREGLRKKLEATEPDVPWGERLEEAAYRLTQAARQSEPLVVLTGTVTSPTRELMPNFLYEGEPTLVFADGDTGKSLSALVIAAAVQGGASLPFGLKAARAVPVAYLDWETSRDTLEARLAQVAAGLGITPPGIVYKHMVRPLVDEVATLAVEFARRGIRLVIVDSMMFAVSTGEGAAFHEPITSFYGALRLFAPAACLVLSHVTGEDARRGGPARPFGGAFAFNGPRLIWEAKRDPEIPDATAIAFTCRKANNLPRRPEPFGLIFRLEDRAIRVHPFNLTEATPQTVAGAPLAYRVRLALATENLTAAELGEKLGASEKTIRRTLERLRDKGTVTSVPETKPQCWRLPGASG